MKKYVVCLLLTIILGISPRVFAAPADTIDPNVLKQFGASIIDGTRPTFTTMTQGDFFSLPAYPTFKADFVKLAFEPDKLLDTQKEIFQKWLKGGHNKVVLFGSDMYKYAKILGVSNDEFHNKDVTATLLINTRHSAATGVIDLVAGVEDPQSDSIYYCIQDGLIENISTVARYKDSLAAAGMFVSGVTSVYFLPKNISGEDADRFLLNFWHWAMGLKVPGE